MPRFYIFTPGSPGYIGTELAVEPIRGGEPEQKGWASDCARMAPGDLIISRAEALEDPRYREALEPLGRTRRPHPGSDQDRAAPRGGEAVGRARGRRRMPRGRMATAPERRT